ncbi:MAG: hypothetical protein FWF44_08780, partial [Defluviitaleaceae bacterium]|nr:hypothetical protein [Defluviitaleaceae bacterium]
LALSFTVIPINASYILIILLVGVQLSAGLELTTVVVLGLLCVLLLYTRLAPRESIFVLGTIAAYYFRVPYLIPILAGLYFSLTCIIPITAGVFLWAFVPVIRSLMVTGAGAAAAAAATTTNAGTAAASTSIFSLDAFTAVLTAIKTSLTTNQEWIFTAFIFAMALLVVYAVSRLSVDHAKDLAIGLGALLMFLGSIVASIVVKSDQNIFVVFIMTVVSAGIAELVKFFDVVVNYQRAERVEFQDEENYYYVKVIPKVILTRRKRVVRRIRSRDEYEE